MNTELSKIVSLAKRRGFIFPGSEVYGGLANTWDYGPYGVELKNNLRNWWWKRFVQDRQDVVGMDPAIFMNPQVWRASGHLTNFADTLIDCKYCKARHRADHLIESVLGQKVEGKSAKELSEIIKQEKIACPNCSKRGTLMDARQFNLLFKTAVGALESDKNEVYLRGELAQGIFINFRTVTQGLRKRLPFGIASVGKAFRNEITPGNFTYRTLEFDLMEFEYFVDPSDWQKYFDYWLTEQKKWLEELGINAKNFSARKHSKQELSHYSKETVDIEYQFAFGKKELFGIAMRSDYDLKQHTKASGQDLRYTDPKDGKKFFPFVIEPTFGLSRLVLAVLSDAYHEQKIKGRKRIFLSFHPKLAPVKCAILPLQDKDGLGKLADSIYQKLRKLFVCEYDAGGSIGKRYRRQDEIGTPFCLTIDYTSKQDKQMTIRFRDSLLQKRVNLKRAIEIIKKAIA